MKDIALYGHLTIDTILEDRNEKKSLGSMANVWKALLEIDPKIDIGLSPIHIGHALIYVDKSSSKRYSKANLNIINQEPKIIDAKINHLVYLNEIEIFDFISQLKGIITADVCSGKPLNKNILKFVDYLFISDEDINCDFSEYAKLTKGWVILHSPFGSVVSNGKEEFSYKLPQDLILKGLNVLGAGDIFASCFLYKLLEGGDNIQKCIEFSHLKTTKILSQYEKV